MDRYLVKYGKRKMYLNPKFLEMNNAEHNLELIKELFVKKFKLFSRMERASKRETLRKLADMVTENEFEIQKAFNFEPDVNFHRFWELPKCVCPRMDNLDSWGTNYSIMRADCILHGK